MSDHSHYGEYADARHRHEGDYALDRHDHDLDYAEKYHRHYDLETDDKTAQQAITCLRVELDELRRQLDGQDVSAAGLALEVTHEPLFSLGGP